MCNVYDIGFQKNFNPLEIAFLSFERKHDQEISFIPCNCGKYTKFTP